MYYFILYISNLEVSMACNRWKAVMYIGVGCILKGTKLNSTEKLDLITVPVFR